MAQRSVKRDPCPAVRAAPRGRSRRSRRSPGPAGCEDVAASSSTDAWAVGSSVRLRPTRPDIPLIEHHDGTSWAISPSADGPAAVQSALSGVAARTASDAWAVGSFTRANNLVRTLIEHWDGTTWTRVQSPNAGQPANGDLSGVAVVAADDVWAVGGYGQGAPGRTLIEHWDGTTWTVVPSPNKGPFPNSLSGVTAIAPDDVWAVGTWFTKAFDDRTLTLHWDGTSWHRVSSPNAGPTSAANDLVSVSANATDDVWAVGSRGLHTLTMHWDGTSWSIVPSPTPGGLADLAAVVAVGPDDVWAAGGSVDRQVNAGRTLVEHWDGMGWKVVDEREQGPERQSPVGDLGSDRPDVGGRRSVQRRRYRPGGAALPGALRPVGPDAPCVSAGGPTIAPCPRSVSPPTSSPPETSRRRSPSSPRASRPGSRTSRSWAPRAPGRRSRSRTSSRPSSARPW